MDLEHSQAKKPLPGECLSTDDPELMRSARLLIAREYLRRGFIHPEDINDDGVIKEEVDPYGDQSKYYVMLAGNGKDIVATVRTIQYNPEKGQQSFPLLSHSNELYPEYRKMMSEIGYENIVEVSALVRDKTLDTKGTAAMKLYKRLFLDAWSGGEDGGSTFIMACNPVLFKNFQLLFDGSMKRIGPDLDYPGQEAVPALFSNHEGALDVIRLSRDRKNIRRRLYQGVVEYFFAGSSDENINKDVLQALKNYGYDELLERMHDGHWGDVDALEKQAINHRIKRAAVMGKGRETLNHFMPELVAGAGLLGYTALRTLAVAKGVSPVSDADWEAFLAIEVATTPPYVLSVGDLIRSAGDENNYSRKRKFGAMTIAASSFAAPYVYLGAEGALTSQQGTAITGGLLAIAALPTIAEAVKRRLPTRRKH